jgi:hypothetical protein
MKFFTTLLLTVALPVCCGCGVARAGANSGTTSSASTSDNTSRNTSSAPNTFALINQGVFTNTQMNEYNQSLLNGCNPAQEFQAAQGANFSTDAVAGCVAMPSGATVHQVNGLAGYASNSVSDSQTGGAVGVYGEGRALVSGPGNNNGNATWGMNSLVQDSPGTDSTQLISNEVDINIFGNPVRAWGILINGGMGPNGVMPQQAAGLEIMGPQYSSGNTAPWPAAIRLPDGSGVHAIDIGTSTTSGASMPIIFTSRDSSGMVHNTAVAATPSGDVSISSGLVLKSPDATKCARIGIDNNGVIAATPISCP